jgi:hypothetical protein
MMKIDKRVSEYPRAWKWLALCALIVSMTSNAKMTIVTLSQLVMKSDVIVLGHFGPPAGVSPTQSSSFVPLQVASILKGGTMVAHGMLEMCNVRENSESPDLSRLTGSFVIFASKKSTCFELSHGDRSIVPTASGRANTVAIEDEPDDQTLTHFLKTVRSLVAKQSGASP